MDESPLSGKPRPEMAEALLRAYCSTRNLSELLCRAAQIIQLPLHVTDPSYKLLTQADLESAADDEVWRDTAELGYLSSGIIAGVVRNHKSDKPVRPGDHIRFVWSSPLSTYPMLVYYLFQSGVLLGHLCALCVRGQPTEQEYAFMDLLSDLIAKHLSFHTDNRELGDKPFESILIELIETDIHDTLVLENRALATGLSNYSSFLVLNIHIEHRYSTLRERLMQIFPYCMVFYYRRQVLALLPCPVRADHISAWEWSKLDQLAEELDALVCISDEFSSIAQLGVHCRKNQRILALALRYRQAMAEHRLFHPMRPFEARVFRYDRVKSADLISQISIQCNLDLLDFVGNGIRKLYDYDRETGANLLQTLLVFIECQKSYLNTAERLFTHKNTIRYRVEKLKQILDTDFSDGGIVARLHLHCTLLQLRELLREPSMPGTDMERKTGI